MKRLGLIGDVHAEDERLATALATFGQERVDAFLGASFQRGLEPLVLRVHVADEAEALHRARCQRRGLVGSRTKTPLASRSCLH